MNRPLLTRALVAAVVVEHLLLIVAPLDVLAPLDAAAIGRAILDLDRPEAFDFYPLLSALAFVLPGLAPPGLGQQVLALQALVLEVAVLWWVLRHHDGALIRYLTLSLLVFPFLSGGFDAFPMAAIAVATALLANEDRRGWWVAAVGAAMKLAPGTAWIWARSHLGTAVSALVATAALLLAPALLWSDAFLTTTLSRGAQVESLASTTWWLGLVVTGGDPSFVYEGYAWELQGAGAVAVLWAAASLGGLVVLGVRARDLDPWMASFLSVVLVLCGSKVLSPQFLAWAAPLAAVVGGRWFLSYALACALTFVTYAVADGDQASVLAVASLRNLVLAGIAVAGLRHALRSRSADGTIRAHASST